MSMSSGLGGSSGSTSFGCRTKGLPGGRRCKCGRQTIVYTSKTERNPNRAFFGCPNFKDKKPFCNFLRWVDDVCNESLELEDGRINKVELDVAEMDFKLKHMDMIISDQLQAKLNDHGVKISEQELNIKVQKRKLNELYLKMAEELDRMDKEIRHVGRAARVLVATCVGWSNFGYCLVVAVWTNLNAMCSCPIFGSQLV
ncbi:uncharacterized protein At4g04775-like [Gastrolobium bilobum]|uniref:uncharacterized protein At4g04775-like n=1 Tax=Gastrolobium bilobum TaxID=150636 RepID=UPI002AB1BD0B|nr:uncharacterized protein At4g04775-like [Gastrolobium bilobum]